MLDRKFQTELTAKFNSLANLAFAHCKLETSPDDIMSTVDDGLAQLRNVFLRALGLDKPDEKPEDEKPDQGDQGSEKTDDAPASAWSTIKRVRHSGLNLGSGETVKGETSAWAGIRRVVPQNLDMGQGDETVKTEDQTSAWGTIRRARNVSGIEV